MPVFEKLRFEEDLKESPRISGTRFSVIQIYEMNILRGLTSSEIAEKYDLEQNAVEQALKYCISHPDEVREQATSPLTIDVVERESRSNNAAEA